MFFFTDILLYWCTINVFMFASDFPTYLHDDAYRSCEYEGAYSLHLDENLRGR